MRKLRCFFVTRKSLESCKRKLRKISFEQDVNPLRKKNQEDKGKEDY